MLKASTRPPSSWMRLTSASISSTTRSAHVSMPSYVWANETALVSGTRTMTLGAGEEEDDDEDEVEREVWYRSDSLM